ncbi:hypothetical protein Nepgr_012990 [Nepenthes gracilis]|uniref:Uncharacterized protein n=1 Tax=Nepenthes gracilis TaxID=150966 RepID=A0AAD3SIA7_NEPGR|nr:hypothetical protein Nepgr_012990 [Nepenthes gracilis]
MSSQREIEEKKNVFCPVEQEPGCHKLHSSEMQEKRALTDRVFSALKYTLSNISSVIACLDSEKQEKGLVWMSQCLTYTKREDLACLQHPQNEIETSPKEDSYGDQREWKDSDQYYDQRIPAVHVCGLFGRRSAKDSGRRSADGVAEFKKLHIEKAAIINMISQLLNGRETHACFVSKCM